MIPNTTGNSSSNSQGGSTVDGQKRIFDRVWKAVEKVMDEMHATLLAQLKEPARSIDEQEKTIEFVFCSNLLTTYASLLTLPVCVLSQDPVGVEAVRGANLGLPRQSTSARSGDASVNLQAP